MRFYFLIKSADSQVCVHNDKICEDCVVKIWFLSHIRIMCQQHRLMHMLRVDEVDTLVWGKQKCKIQDYCRSQNHYLIHE